MAFPELTERLFRLLQIKQSDVPATTIDLDRPLTTEEGALIEWLLLHGEAGAQDFLPQVKAARVHGRCSCGCPSIDMVVSQTTPAATVEVRLLADFVGTVEKELVGVLLHQCGGRLAELEIYAFGESPVPFRLPEISTLRRWEVSGPALDKDPAGSK